ncbi:bromodomain-containing protein 4-like [Helianthus annuus]|uniref:bromodomain-containing protein 4-like n=1 Tax=Helianthus annuus TaxID=4232 RepID=UPI000B8EF4AA|nr:bromodomain-containing protein 4-like [Helianthus annuus]
MLVDEPEEDEAEAETGAEGNVEGDQVSLTPESAKLLKAINKELAAGNEEGDDGDKSSSSSSDEDIDETEQSQTPPSSDGRKKQSARKRVATLRAKGLKILLKKKPFQKPSKPPTPPPEPQHQLSPIHSPLHQTPPRQPSPIQSPPHLSPPHLSPPHIHVATPPHEQQPVVTSQQFFQTPPSTQPHVQITPGSSGYKTFPTVPEGITLEEIGDFGFANDEQVKRLEKKMEEVLVENKKLWDRERKLEKRVKSVEAENTSLLKKIEADQTEIDILKVKVAELEEKKAHRYEKNKYFELKKQRIGSCKSYERT